MAGAIIPNLDHSGEKGQIRNVQKNLLSGFYCRMRHGHEGPIPNENSQGLTIVLTFRGSYFEIIDTRETNEVIACFNLKVNSYE